MGEYAKAEPLLQEALRIRQKVLGPEHPDTAISLNKLAGLYVDIGEYAKAEPLLQSPSRSHHLLTLRTAITDQPEKRRMNPTQPRTEKARAQ